MGSAAGPRVKFFGRYGVKKKNSKFRRLNLLQGVPRNISVRFYRSPIKTVGGVCKSTKKCLKLTSLAPAPVEPKIGQPRNVCPDITFSKMHLPYRFRDNRTSGKWSKSPNRQTDRQTSGRTFALIHLRRLRPQIKTPRT